MQRYTYHSTGNHFESNKFDDDQVQITAVKQRGTRAEEAEVSVCKNQLLLMNNNIMSQLY